VRSCFFAIGASCGFGPGGDAGPFNPFGLIFLVLAVLAWRCWHIVTGGYGASGFDGMAGRVVNPGGSADHYRGTDGHYRRGERATYRKTRPAPRR
jgi:hypothetical protein